jgi:ADP-ribosylglycohydrolase
MIGAIAGDMIGSHYEFHSIKTTDFSLFSPKSRFTDDTVLTVALADSILTGADSIDNLKKFYALYPSAGYGGAFSVWARSSTRVPYNSFGNGSAMRISPVGFAYDSLEKTLDQAVKFTIITHNHPEGIKGACAVAAAIYLARTGSSKEQIRSFIEDNYSYNLHRSIEEIRPAYSFEVICQRSVPEAIIAFLDSTNFESAVRLAVSLGGDSDTQACIAGGIAQAFYGGVPRSIQDQAVKLLDPYLQGIVQRFTQIYLK